MDENILIFEPTEEDIKEFGRDILSVAWSNYCHSQEGNDSYVRL
jgi:hypothetical protein